LHHHCHTHIHTRRRYDHASLASITPLKRSTNDKKGKREVEKKNPEMENEKET
jgi:hypothetical protein